jgi:hypothetical protein
MLIFPCDEDIDAFGAFGTIFTLDLEKMILRCLLSTIFLRLRDTSAQAPSTNPPFHPNHQAIMSKFSHHPYLPSPSIPPTIQHLLMKLLNHYLANPSLIGTLKL